MGKYLQDIMITKPEFIRKGKSKDDEVQFYSQFSETVKSVKVIQDLYNYNLPRKFNTGQNIWRFIIVFTLQKEQHYTVEFLGDVYKIYCYIDNDALKAVKQYERKEIIFNAVSNTIKEICKNLECPHLPFQEIEDSIKTKGIVFNEPFRDPKKSSNKKLTAKLWILYTENEMATFLKVFDNNEALILNVKLCECHFSKFDRIEWMDSDKINVYTVNEMHPSKNKKMNTDFFQVTLTGELDYFPQTKQAIFDYGVELMKAEKTFEDGLGHIRKADALQHGKAANVLLNLKLNKDERDLTILLQEPRKRALPK